MKVKNRGPYLLSSKLRSTVYYNGLYSLTIKVNYQTNLTKTITMRVERRKKKRGRLKSWNFHYRRKIRYVANFCYWHCSSSWLLFNCSLLLLFTLHYSISSRFDIPHYRLVKIDRKPYEIDENQPDFVMIGLTR